MKKICRFCDTEKKSRPTPDGDEICPSCGDREMDDIEFVSNCCSAPVTEYGMCYACGEMCEAVETE